LHVGYEEHFLS